MMDSIVDVNGKKWPCYRTGGSLLRYLRAAKAQGLKDGDPSDQWEAAMLLLQCDVQSACAQEGREMPPADLQEFLDLFGEEAVLEFTRAQREEMEALAEKKTKSAPQSSLA